MELPWTCPGCGNLNMVEMDCLVERPVGKIKTEMGYICPFCHTFQGIFLTTNSLNEALEKLGKIRITHKDFRFHFAKALKKALGIQQEKVCTH